MKKYWIRCLIPALVLIIGAVLVWFRMEPSSDPGYTVQEESRGKILSNTGYLYNVNGGVMRYATSLQIDGDGKEVHSHAYADEQFEMGDQQVLTARIYVPELDKILEKSTTTGGSGTYIGGSGFLNADVEYKGTTYSSGIIVSATLEVTIGGQKLRPLTLYRD